MADETAKGLVHRYLVYVQQNARKVSLRPPLATSMCIWSGCCCLRRRRAGRAGAARGPAAGGRCRKSWRCKGRAPPARLPASAQGTASTLTRGEVRGGGRKPYKQKGSGNARRGSRRSPLMPGGGISFGPKPRDWSIDMNKKERRLALATALQVVGWGSGWWCWVVVCWQKGCKCCQR